MAIASTLAIPGFGRVRILSTHVSWGAPQVAQLKALKDFAAEGGAADAIIVCGDFNMSTGTQATR
jgi:endonuclease/exonuclease/phosphatase family metal-dependent hydrolase